MYLPPISTIATPVLSECKAECPIFIPSTKEQRYPPPEPILHTIPPPPFFPPLLPPPPPLPPPPYNPALAPAPPTIAPGLIASTPPSLALISRSCSTIACSSVYASAKGTNTTSAEVLIT